MRAASSCAANPPNTTECTAPSRAHASIAIAASGTIGMDHHAVALADTQAAQRAREPRGFVEQFVVGVGARCDLGHGGVVDQRRLVAAAALDMAVQRVGAGVELASGNHR